LRPVDLDLQPMDLDLMISESEDLDLEEEDLDLPPWDLTTSLAYRPIKHYTCLLSAAQLVKALAAPTHVRSCVQEVRIRSPEQTSSTLASITPGYR